MPDSKKTADSKRTVLPRYFSISPDFLKDWESLSRSGKHDMHRLKEAMVLLIANDGPLSAEWKDHQLKGSKKSLRECHVKGDLLLIYQVGRAGNDEIVIFARAGTHSELFGR